MSQERVEKQREAHVVANLPAKRKYKKRKSDTVDAMGEVRAQKHRDANKVANMTDERKANKRKSDTVANMDEDRHLKKTVSDQRGKVEKRAKPNKMVKFINARIVSFCFRSIFCSISDIYHTGYDCSVRRTPRWRCSRSWPPPTSTSTPTGAASTWAR